ncbi:hypothetical protein BaRGS_00016107, partial [Batillaria attramentaria]
MASKKREFGQRMDVPMSSGTLQLQNGIPDDDVMDEGEAGVMTREVKQKIWARGGCALRAVMTPITQSLVDKVVVTR